MLPNTPGAAARQTLGRLHNKLSAPMVYSPDGETVLLEPKIGIGERLSGDPTNLIIDRAVSALDEASHDDEGVVLYKASALVGF